MNGYMKALLTTASLLVLFTFAGCDSDDSTNLTGHVTVSKNAMYYEVKIDYSSGNRYDIGREYGTKVLATVPGYEKGSDAFLVLSVKAIHEADPEITYEVLIQRSLDIFKNIQPSYTDEIEGFTSVLSGGTTNVPGDGKLSHDEYLMLVFVPDIFNTTACSAAAVYGDRSATGQTIVGRNTDWAAGPPSGIHTGIGDDTDWNVNAVIHAVTSVKQTLSFGNIGILGAIVGINSDGIFVAGLHSQTGSDYSAVGKRSVMLDIRNTLETCGTVDEAGAFMGDPARLYAYHNNIFIADKNTARVLENDYERNRALRASAKNT